MRRKKVVSFATEVDWVAGKLIVVNNDRNPNRAAQLQALEKYLNDLCIARRSREMSEMRPRPDLDRSI